MIDGDPRRQPGPGRGLPRRQGGPARLLRRPGDEGDAGKGRPACGQRAAAGEARRVSAEPVRLLWERMEARDWEARRRPAPPRPRRRLAEHRERMRGRENYLAVQRAYPEGWHIEVLRIVDGGDQRRLRGPRRPGRQAVLRDLLLRARRRQDRPGGRVLVGWRAESAPALARRAGRSRSSGSPGTPSRPTSPVSAPSDDWWGGRCMVDMLPKLLFAHFRDVLRRRAGRRAGRVPGRVPVPEPSRRRPTSTSWA